MTDISDHRPADTVQSVSRRLRQWLSTHLIQVLGLITPIVLTAITVYFTADLDDLASRYHAFRKWATPAVEFVTTVFLIAAVLVAGLFCYMLFSALAATARRITDAYYYSHVRALRRLCEDRDNTLQRLAIIEERLRIGNHAMLNLPDNLLPEQIALAVGSYEREQHLARLWQRLKSAVAGTADGYLVVDMEANSVYATHYKTRQTAERALNDDTRSGRVLVHVIATDWPEEG